MKVPCTHGFYDAHPNCTTCLSYGGHCFFHESTPICPGGESPTDEQLITELRKRGTLILDDRGNTDRLVTRWSHYHQDRT